MKKLAIVLILIVALLFVMGTDMVVNPVQRWVADHQQDPAAPKVLYTMAAYLFKIAQRDAKAVELYQSAFKMFPGYPDERVAHYRIGFFYESEKNYPKAIEEYQIIVQKWPDFADKQSLNQRIERFRAYQGGP